MRIDRWLTLRAFSPWRRSRVKQEAALPVLMYHSISDDSERGVQPYYRTHTSPARFEEQMGFLSARGYKTITLGDALSLLEKPESSFGRKVVLTFDDGFRNFLSGAFPALQKYGFTATIFLPTAFIRSGSKGFKGQECLAWDEVKTLRRSGITFGSHTVNHPKLIELPPREIERELRDSKSEMETELAEQVEDFAYPYAFPSLNQDFIAAFQNTLRHTGYRSCATTELGRARLGSDPFRLKRLPVNSLDDMSLFEAKLQGAYDWVASLQNMRKRCPW
jgi:peptidoglycan/xylan/chitin deacetylase (PgdA/CDA1 family)